MKGECEKVPVFVIIRQNKQFPIVQVIMEGLHCEDEQLMFNMMFRIMDIAIKNQAIFIPEKDIPPITKGKQIQIGFTAHFKNMPDADFFVNGISNM